MANKNRPGSILASAGTSSRKITLNVHVSDSPLTSFLIASSILGSEARGSPFLITSVAWQSVIGLRKYDKRSLTTISNENTVNYGA